MPYPKRTRKHPELDPKVASARALEPYKWRPGFTSNSNAPRDPDAKQLFLEAQAIGRVAGPGAIRRLAELAGIPLNGETWTPLDKHDVDYRVVYQAAFALAERVYGRPRDFNPADHENINSKPNMLNLSSDEREAFRRLATKALRPLAHVHAEPDFPTDNDARAVDPDTADRA